jgi:hypothetical protein
MDMRSVRRPPIRLQRPARAGFPHGVTPNDFHEFTGLKSRLTRLLTGSRGVTAELRASARRFSDFAP